MSTSQLYSKLALERCRMHVAQLCATAYLQGEDERISAMQQEMLSSLLRGLSQDLDVLEQLIQSEE